MIVIHVFRSFCHLSITSTSAYMLFTYMSTTRKSRDGKPSLILRERYQMSEI